MLYKYKLVSFYWWLNGFIKTVLQHMTFIFTWGAAGITEKLFSLKRSISYTRNVKSACPWAWWFVREIKCTSLCRAVLQRSTNKMEHHRSVTNFPTYSPSKSGGANSPPAPPCVPALLMKFQSQIALTQNYKGQALKNVKKRQYC